MPKSHWQVKNEWDDALRKVDRLTSQFKMPKHLQQQVKDIRGAIGTLANEHVALALEAESAQAALPPLVESSGSDNDDDAPRDLFLASVDQAVLDKAVLDAGLPKKGKGKDASR